jgi:hypothetical protein
VLLVTGYQRRVGLGRQIAGKVKRAGSQRTHFISSDLRLPAFCPGLRLCGMTRVLRQAPQ